MRVRLLWTRAGQVFEGVEPDAALVERHATQLRDWYNAPENAVMMDGSGQMSRDDVLDFWNELRSAGGRGFLGFVDGELVGDADLRGLRGRIGEFAVMIGSTRHKGRGIGRTLALMVHVFAFRELALDRIYVPPRRDNMRVHALNTFLGYERDDSSTARAFCDSADSEPHSIGPEAIRSRHPEAWRDVTISPVEQGSGS